MDCFALFLLDSVFLVMYNKKSSSVRNKEEAMKKVTIFGVHVDKLTMEEALEVVKRWIGGDTRGHVIYTPNSEIISLARRDQSFCDLLNTADMVTPDGIGVVKAAHLLGDALPERVGGFDLTERAIAYLGEVGGRLYILGGKPGVADAAAQNLQEKYPRLVIAGVNDGYFTKDAPVVEKIAAAAPDYLMVCLGAPKQEKFIGEHREALFAKVIIGAGGSADVFAGEAKRAPEFFIRHNLEWLYRIVKGKRLRRSLSLFAFGFSVLCYRLTHGRATDK